MCSVKERIRTYLRVCIDEMDFDKFFSGLMFMVDNCCLK